MTNYERYLEIHNEVMNRLENGEITTEQAKEVNDLAFEKYVVEFAEDDDDNLEFIEESARQKYAQILKEKIEQLKKECDRLENLRSHAMGDKKKEIERRLLEARSKLHEAKKTYERTCIGTEKHGKYNDANDDYDDDEILTAKHNFEREYGSKYHGKHDEMHDNVNRNSKK